MYCETSSVSPIHGIMSSSFRLWAVIEIEELLLVCRTHLHTTSSWYRFWLRVVLSGFVFKRPSFHVYRNTARFLGQAFVHCSDLYMKACCLEINTSQPFRYRSEGVGAGRSLRFPKLSLSRTRAKLVHDLSNTIANFWPSHEKQKTC